jgi:hypothetical protein
MTLMNQRPNRRESKTEKIVDSIPEVVSTEIFETLPPESTRYLSIEFSDGKEINRLEITRIGFIQYRRKNGELWLTEDLRNKTPSSSGGGMSRNPCIQYSQQNSVVAGKSVIRFQSFFVGNSTKGLSFSNSQFWLDSSGAIIREEDSSGLLEPRLEQYRTTKIYNYDAQFKIEAPIIP